MFWNLGECLDNSPNSGVCLLIAWGLLTESSKRICPKSCFFLDHLPVPLQRTQVLCTQGRHNILLIGWTVLGFCWFLSGRTPDTWLARCNLVKQTHLDHGGCRHPAAAIVPRPWRRRTQQSVNMMRDKSVSLKLEDVIFLLFISYVKALRVVSMFACCGGCQCPILASKTLR